MSEKPTYEELEGRVLELEEREHYRNEIVAFPQFEKHGAIILIIDPDSGIIINANIAAQNYYGYSIKTLKQMKIHEINMLSPDKVAEKRQQAANEKLNCFEFSHRLSSGETRTVEVHSSPIIINDKKYLLSIINDITERKQAEENLLRKHEMLKRTEAISHVGSWEWVIETDTVTWSDELYRIFQLNPDGKAPNWDQHPKLYHPEDFEKLRQAVETAMTDGKTYELELRAFRKDGETRICKAIGFPETGRDGHVVRLFGFLQDITDQKRSEDSIRKSESFLKSLLDSIPIPVFYKDSSGRYIGVNKSFEQFFGKKENELLGKTVFDINPPDLANSYSAKDQKLLDDGGTQEYESQVQNVSGERRDVVFNKAVFHDQGGNVLGLIGAIQDITDRKRIEEALRNREAVLEDAQEVARIGSWEYNVKTGELEWTKELFKIYGLSTDVKPRFEDAIESIHPDDKHAVLETFDKAIKHLIPYEMEYRIIRNDGEERYIHSIGKIKTANKDGVLSVYGTGQDITERKLQEKQLVALEKRNQALLDHSPVCHKIVGLEFNLQYMSVNGFKMLKLDHNADVYGKPYPFYFFPEAFKSRMTEKLKQVKETGEVKTLEALTNDIDGNEVWLDSSLIPVFDDENKIDFITVVSADITQRKQDEKERLRLEKQLLHSQKMESIGQLAGGIAHDFNNILYPILGFTQMSMDELPENHPVRENLQDVMDGAKRARDLVKRILLFSRQKDKKLEPLLIKSSIEEALKLLRSSMPVNIDIESQLYDGEDFVLCDETEIHEIVMNLCTNAYHSMDQKGDTIKVDLNKKVPPPDLELPSGEYLCLSVGDNGAGIKTENLQHIFEPYFTTKEVGKGSGLGLSVVHGIVKSYQGDITVESSLDKGTVFKIFLPITTQSDIPQPEKEPSDLLMGNEKILFVDDEKAIVKLGTRVLEKVGFTVTGAMECLEALALFKKNPEKYDLIITDMTMPGMVGTELAQKISEINPDVPVLICSGYSEKLDKSVIEISNIKGYLDKPILADKLIVKVREILDQNKDRNEKDIDN